MKKQTERLIGLLSFLLCMSLSFPAYPADSTWIHKFTVPDKNVSFTDVIQTSAGGYLAIGGVFDSTTGDTYQNALITRIDADGQVLWSRNYSFPGRWEDTLYSVVESGDGGFIATGRILLEGTDGNGNTAANSADHMKKLPPLRCPCDILGQYEKPKKGGSRYVLYWNRPAQENIFSYHGK